MTMKSVSSGTDWDRIALGLEAITHGAKPGVKGLGFARRNSKLCVKLGPVSVQSVQSVQARVGWLSWGDRPGQLSCAWILLVSTAMLYILMHLDTSQYISIHLDPIWPWDAFGSSCRFSGESEKGVNYCEGYVTGVQALTAQERHSRRAKTQLEVSCKTVPRR